MSNADRYTLETPENIEVEFELAGVGSRFCAMFIDALLIGLLALVLIVSVLLLGLASAPVITSGPEAGRLVDWLLAVVWAIAAVLIFDGYFILFELAMRGQTPGKNAMKVRVIRDDGTPITLNEVLVRNVLRIVDFLPVGYAVGAVVMFFNPLCKRLGDVAAGTIVVKEGRLDYRAHADEKHSFDMAAVSVSNSELTPEERRVLTGFLQRREELSPQARATLAERLAKPLHEKYGGCCTDSESYVQRLVEGRHYES
jgi:uncharacterized RDD family membrane protein YckC